MCFYLQQHLLNKDKKKPSPSYSASWGRAQAPAESPRCTEQGGQLEGFYQPGWFNSGVYWGGGAGFAGLKAGVFLGIHVQSGPVAGVEDPSLLKLVAEQYHGERI